MTILRLRRSSFPQKSSFGLLTFISVLIFFFVIFDGVLMYLAPIVMSRSGLGESKIGIILGLSSVAGMAFDVLLSKVLKTLTYRTIFLSMLVIASSYPLFLFGAHSVLLFLLAMAVWGLYYNLYNIGTLDFVSREKMSRSHAHTFGVLKVFDGLGYLIAPFIGSTFFLVLIEKGYSALSVIFLLIPSYAAYIALLAHKRLTFPHIALEPLDIRKNFLDGLKELLRWKRVGIALLPALLLTFTINTVDSAIWTIGPLFSESLGGLSYMKGSYFMLAYTLPPLLVGWFVGHLVKRYGKKNIAIGLLFLGSVALAFIGFFSNPLILLVVIFGASFCLSLSWPSINSVYADDIARDGKEHEEIESVEDLFTNMGDVTGPILAGFLAEAIGFSHAFLWIGSLGAIFSLCIFFFSPKRI